MSLRSLRVLLVLGAMTAGVNDARGQLARDWNVVVIGGGLMGSATAWQLARAGQTVLLLEKQGPEYSQGSSRGEARISRSLGPPGDVWSYMHNRTVTEAKELVAFLGERGESVGMDAIYTTSPVNYVRHESRLAGYSWLEDQDDRYEVAWTPKEARDAFGLVMPEKTFLVREYKEYSGTIDPSAVIELAHRGTTLLGGRIAYGHEVTRLSRIEGGYELEVRSVDGGTVETVRTPRVVSAAGPYTGRLLRDIAPEFDALITPKRVFLAFFEVRPERWARMSASERASLMDLFPAINSTIPTREASSFSMVERITDRGTPILKIGGHFQRSEIADLDAVWQESLQDEEIAWARESLLRHLSLLGLGIDAGDLLLDAGYSCVYSLTENEVPYVTHASLADGTPDPNLVVVGGLSGVGAKGSLAYGVIAADLLLGRSESDPVYLEAREAFGFERMRRDAAERTSSP